MRVLLLFLGFFFFVACSESGESKTPITHEETPVAPSAQKSPPTPPSLND